MDRLLHDLLSRVVYKFHCNEYNSFCYSETIRHLKVSSGEHIGYSPLTFKDKSSIKSFIHNYSLFCGYSSMVSSQKNLLIQRDNLELYRKYQFHFVILIWHDILRLVGIMLFNRNCCLILHSFYLVWCRIFVKWYRYHSLTMSNVHLKRRKKYRFFLIWYYFFLFW